MGGDRVFVLKIIKKDRSWPSKKMLCEIVVGEKEENCEEEDVERTIAINRARSSKMPKRMKTQVRHYGFRACPSIIFSLSQGSLRIWMP